MGARITTSMLLRTALANVSRQRERLAQTQEQASSGLRINRPSDDPAGVQTALSIRAAQEATDQFVRNADRAQGRLRSMESALSRAKDIVTEAKAIAVNGATEVDQESRAILAQEIAALHDELLTRANARHTGGYLFGGFRNDTQAFTVSGPFVSGSPPPTVTFNGDANEIQTVIEEGASIPSTLNGQRVFLGDGDGDGSPDPGREDIFDTLADLFQALDTNNRAGVQTAIDRLDRAEQQLVLERERIGAAGNRLETARDANRDAVVDLAARLSSVEDADTVAVLSDLVSQETALQASLEAAARIVQPSILDFLR